jgi:predicted secreted protein
MTVGKMIELLAGKVSVWISPYACTHDNRLVFYVELSSMGQPLEALK